MQILIVGEYLTNTDLEAGGAFRGKLNSMIFPWLRQVGIDPRECTFMNVFPQASPGRGIDGFFGPKSEAVPGMKMFKRGSYLRKEYAPALAACRAAVVAAAPNVVIALGDLALWALTSEASLKFARGRIAPGNSTLPNLKVLPTYSPAQIMADWTLRPILLADLEKARRESAFAEIRRPQRFIHLYPSLSDLEDFFSQYIEPCTDLDCDIETKGTMITCVGFAPSPSRALVIPFYDEEKPDGNYWPTAADEYAAWQFVRRCLRAGKRLGGQNFQYDMQYLWRQMGIKSPDFADDTMLLHHALQPEMQKGLGFLASIYTDELAWKFMHKISASDKSAKKASSE